MLRTAMAYAELHLGQLGDKDNDGGGADDGSGAGDATADGDGDRNSFQELL